MLASYIRQLRLVSIGHRTHLIQDTRHSRTAKIDVVTPLFPPKALLPLPYSPSVSVMPIRIAVLRVGSGSWQTICLVDVERDVVEEKKFLESHDLDAVFAQFIRLLNRHIVAAFSDELALFRTAAGAAGRAGLRTIALFQRQREQKAW
jgi:hypothetical protein